MKKAMQPGDMYVCQSCFLEIQVTKPCKCESQCVDFRCCGQPMKELTEPAVREATKADQRQAYRASPNHETVEMPSQLIAEQAEKAKSI